MLAARGGVLGATVLLGDVECVEQAPRSPSERGASLITGSFSEPEIFTFPAGIGALGQLDVCGLVSPHAERKQVGRSGDCGENCTSAAARPRSLGLRFRDTDRGGLRVFAGIERF